MTVTRARGGRIRKYICWLWYPQLWAGLLIVVLTTVGGRDIIRHHAVGTHPTAVQKPSTVASGGKVAGDATTMRSIDCTAQPCLALTFDDGPNPITTPQILDILEREHVHASFFVVGSRVGGNEALLRRMVADGDEIGNHSWSHPDFTTLTAPQIIQQIDQAQQAVTAAGVPAPILFRPPYGRVNKLVIDSVPLAIMFWNEDPRDWAASSPVDVQNTLLSAARPGGVVDMHDIYHVTVNALDPIIQTLKQRRYRLVTVTQLLNIQPGQRGEYYGRP